MAHRTVTAFRAHLGRGGGLIVGLSEQQVRAAIQSHWLSKASNAGWTVRSTEERVPAVGGQVMPFSDGSAIRWACPLCERDHEDQLDEFDEFAKLCFCERGNGQAVLVEWGRHRRPLARLRDSR